MKIRVVEVLATLKRAGAERMAVSLARGLDPRRFETRVVSLYDAFPGGFEPELEAAGIPVEHLGKRRGLDPRMWWRLARVFRAARPSIVHTHSYVLRYSLPAALTARAGRMVHTVHNVAEKEVDALGRIIQRQAFRRRVTPVAVAGEVARSFEELYGFPPACTIPNGIETERFRRPGARERWRRAHRFSDELLVVSVARLDPQKNPRGLVDAFARAFPGVARAHLLLAGEGSERESVRQRAAECGVAERVQLLGVQQDVAELLAAADLFALASRWEGHPLAVMEAMAAGLPVVATAVGGVPELVEDGVTGWLVPPDDARALAEALAMLAAATGRRAAMAQAALRRAEGFSVEAMIAAYAALFERLVEARP